jgi:hypothetical protein
MGRLAFQLEALPYSTANELALNLLAKRPDSIGGIALGKLYGLLPGKREDMIDDLIANHLGDWNFVQSFASSSAAFFAETDASLLLAKLSKIPSYIETASVFGDFLQEQCHLEEILSCCKIYLEDDTVARYALIYALQKIDRRESREILSKQIAKSQDQAVFSLHMNSSFTRRTMMLANFHRTTR